MTLLLREAIGGSLRRARTARRRTLRDVSGAARVSLGYLSEVERGRKEASSELLAAICDALELSLPQLLGDAAAVLRPARLDHSLLVLTAPIVVGGAPVTFTKHIAPILQRSCENCHRPDGVAPMSLVTYEDVRPWAQR